MSVVKRNNQRIFLYPLILISFVFFKNEIQCQAFTARVNILSTNSSFNKLIDDSLAIEPEGLVKSVFIDVDFTYRFKLKNNLQPYIRFGVLHEETSQEFLNVSLTSSAREERESLQTFKGFAISGGVFKELMSKERWSLLANLDLKYFFSTESESNSMRVAYDTSGDFQSLAKTKSIFPLQRDISLSPGFRIEYSISEKLAINLNTNYVIAYRTQVGKTVDTSILENEQGEVIARNVFTSEKKDKNFSFGGRQISLGISWYLKKRKSS